MSGCLFALFFLCGLFMLFSPLTALGLVFIFLALAAASWGD